MMLRAVIYARCSTEEESQKDALAKQVQEGEECVRQKGWRLVDSYIESRSGTTTKGRTEYNRLYKELAEDKFDVIVIKSQDRLMRNTKDWYLFIDRLCLKQKKLYIYIEQKFYSMDDALITGIKAILAEEYSRELSKKSNNAHRNRQKNNGTVVLNSNTYGYRKLPDKSVEIVEEEAAVKRRMYELCAAGFGARRIARILREDGILNRNGKPFTDSAILRMLHSPLNMGTVVMNRVHYDFEAKRTVKVPPGEQYIYENKIPAIVSKELWEQANRAIAERSAGKSENLSSSCRGNKERQWGRFWLSGKLYCGICGSPYYRRTRRRYRDGKIIYEWKCKSYLEGGRVPRGNFKNGENSGCSNVHLEEERLFELLENLNEKHLAGVWEKAAGKNLENITEKMIENITENITEKMAAALKRALEKRDVKQELERKKEQQIQLQRQMDRLVDKLLEGVISDERYRWKQKELEEKMQCIQEKTEILKRDAFRERELQDRIAVIEEELKRGTLIERAGAVQLLKEADRIEIFPEHMELQYNSERTWIDYGSLFDYQKKKQEEREAVIEMIRENPAVTAKEIAEKMNISLSGANYRLRALKREGKIRFAGSGGKGVWEIC